MRSVLAFKRHWKPSAFYHSDSDCMYAELRTSGCSAPFMIIMNFGTSIIGGTQRFADRSWLAGQKGGAKQWVWLT